MFASGSSFMLLLVRRLHQNVTVYNHQSTDQQKMCWVGPPFCFATAAKRLFLFNFSQIFVCHRGHGSSDFRCLVTIEPDWCFAKISRLLLRKLWFNFWSKYICLFCCMLYVQLGQKINAVTVLMHLTDFYKVVQDIKYGDCELLPKTVRMWYQAHYWNIVLKNLLLLCDIMYFCCT